MATTGLDVSPRVIMRPQSRSAVGLLSFALLLVVCVLWGPAANSRMYAYHEDDVAEVWDEADAITENFGEDTGKTIATDVFSLEEEDGNAKLE